VPVQRGYRQACGIARALDLVGERWALLVIRELLLGPKRFSDLQQALPTASPNALTDRLRELSDAGVIHRRTLPHPGRSHVYELTDWGRGLEPIVIGLGTWALAKPPTDEQEFVSADSAMLTIRTYYRPTTKAAGVLRIDLTDHGSAGLFGVRLTDNGADVRHEPPETPDATIATTTATLLTALGRRSLRPLNEKAVIEGDVAVVQHLIENTVIPTTISRGAPD